MKNNIIKRVSKLNDKDGTAKFNVSYKVPKDNFDGKLENLYKELFENNTDNDDIEECTSCGGVGGGGATSTFSAMQDGGSNPDAGTYTAPAFGKDNVIKKDPAYSRPKGLSVNDGGTKKIKNIKQNFN